MSKIAVTTTTFGQYDNSPLELCKKRGHKVVLNHYGRKINPKELLRIAKDAVGIVAGTEPFTPDLLSSLPELRVISRCGAGLENIDLNAAKKLGIKVFNIPDVLTVSVAELTIGLMLNLLRKISQMHFEAKNGKWQKLTGSLLNKKRVGIIGLGRIGKEVARLLKSFDCEIAYTDPAVKRNVKGLKRLPLEKLLGWADIVSLHVSGKNTVLGKKQLWLMKKGAWLINVSRGGVVDEGALYKALKERRLSGVALDVFQKEPYKGKLRQLDNVILTPHIGSYAKEARIKMERIAVDNLLRGLEE